MKGTTTITTWHSDRMMTMRSKCNSSWNWSYNCRRHYALVPAVLLVLLLLCLAIESSVGGKTTTIVRHTDTTNQQVDGFWTNRTSWNARWVKYWRAKRIYEPVWKKVWTPTILTEFVPLPNAPEPDAWKKPQNNHLHSDDD